MKDSFEQTWQAQGNQIPALRLQQSLALIKTHIESYQRRWFWELLQNASDYNSSVDIRLEVSDGVIKFSHNGDYFSEMDMFNLVRPFSGKQNDPVHQDNIGRFGTGLVSTHILSSIIAVNGIVKSDDGVLNSFNVNLDRSCYDDTDALTRKIADAKDELMSSLSSVIPEQGGFSTSFTYNLLTPLPGIPKILISDESMQYLYNVLPYTMCFLRKVKSILISDNRSGNVHSYAIKQEGIVDDEIVFSIELDGTTTKQSYRIFTRNNVQTVLNCGDNEVKPYPVNMPKFFCGLPMVGTELIGLPIVVNSIKFEPSTERDAIELVPGQNEGNRALVSDAALLFGDVLRFISQKKLKNAFHVSRLRKKYNCSLASASNTQFYQKFVVPAAQELQRASIVRNAEGDFIPLQSAWFPYENNKTDDVLYSLCADVMKSSLPHQEDYAAWVDALDFNLVPRQYTKEQLYSTIDGKSNITDFTTVSSDNKGWLYKVVKYAKEKDAYVTSRFKMLPSQNGTLLLASSLYHDDNIPALLKNLYNSLRSDKIESILLDPLFDSLGVVANIKSTQDVANVIDVELREKYKQNNSNPQTIIDPIRRLYSWIKEQQESKLMTADALRSCFPWFYPKQATLIVDCLSDKERDQALIIAQSGGMEALASLANSMTPEQLQFMQQNITKLQMFFEKENSEKLEVKSDNGASVDIAIADTPYAGLAVSEMKNYLEQAKLQVRQTMERQGFDFSSAVGMDASTYGNVYGVKDSQGVEYPLVVHSYRNNTREFALTAMDWKQLAQRNSMLWLVTSNGAKCVEFYKLMAGHGRISLSFNVDNCESKSKMIALAEIMRDFRGLHFDFGSLQDTFSNIAVRFNQPEKELAEKLGSDDLEMLF